MIDLTCFKAYDIRGEIGVNIDEDMAYRIGRAAAQHLKAKTVVIGFDARETSPAFAARCCEGSYGCGIRRVKYWHGRYRGNVLGSDGVWCLRRDWRFNLRRSNTEPLVRLNIEARGGSKGLKLRVADISKMLGGTIA